MSDLYANYKATRRFAGLDGLRCVSICVVMYFHFAEADPRLGRLGVELFFIISGFLITTILLRERESSGRISIRYFWMRRVLRIFPIYFGFILFQIVAFRIITLDSTMTEDFLQNLPAFLTFTNNWFVHLSDEHPVVFYHAWSLAAEEQFYLFWPLMLIWLRTPRAMALAMTLLIAFDIAATMLFTDGSVDLGRDGNAILTSLQPTICLGVIAAVALDHRRTHHLLVPILSRFWVSPGLALFAVALIYGGITNLATHLVMTLFVVSVIFPSENPLRALLRNPAVEFVGRISYGMYIMHMVAVNGVRIVILPNYPPHSWPIIVCGFGLTICAGAVSFYLYERPFLQLRNRFRPARTMA